MTTCTTFALPHGVAEFCGRIGRRGIEVPSVPGVWWAEWMPQESGRTVVLRYWVDQGIGNVYALSEDGNGPGDLLGGANRISDRPFSGVDKLAEREMLRSASRPVQIGRTTIGVISTHSAAIVRRPIGTRLHQGTRFQLAVTPGKTPVIRCPETGKVWTISWDKLMDLAIEDGVSTPVEEALEPAEESEE